jgi:prepilin-type processing-associated H-X9-DG protein
MTNYVAVVGPETVWPAPGACSIGDISDGTSNTIIVVEVAGSGIHWAEPRDLHVMQMSPDVNPSAGMGLSSRHEGGTHVLFGDGSVRFIANATPRKTLQALLTRAGGEVIDDDF